MASAIQTLVSHLFGDAVSPYIVGLIADKIRGNGLTPSALGRYTALEYALFVPNFFLVISGGFYLISTFFISEDINNCNVEIHRRQFAIAENDSLNQYEVPQLNIPATDRSSSTETAIVSVSSNVPEQVSNPNFDAE